VIRLNCSSESVQLEIPPCAGQPTAAALQRFQCTIPLQILLPPGDPPYATVTLAIPSDTPRGVYALQIDSPCGCHRTRVFVDNCPPPALPGTHVPTRPPTSVPECCLPTGERALTGLAVIIEDDRLLLAPFPPAIIGQPFTARDTSGRVIASGTITQVGDWAALAGDFPSTNIHLEIGPP
jgi:hypothetical protein